MLINEFSKMFYALLCNFGVTSCVGNFTLKNAEMAHGLWEVGHYVP